MTLKMKKTWHVVLKKIAIISLTVVLFLAGILFLFSLPWLLLACGLMFLPNPPAPEITYGEFPFELVYEIDGEQIEVRDTLIIEYMGVGYNEGMGKYRKWKKDYKNEETTEESLTLFDEYVEGVGSVGIRFVLGSCEYYMGLDETDTFYKYMDVNPGDIVIFSRNETRTITEDELYNDYNIRIIKKSISSPIE